MTPSLTGLMIMKDVGEALENIGFSPVHLQSSLPLHIGVQSCDAIVQKRIEALLQSFLIRLTDKVVVLTHTKDMTYHSLGYKLLMAIV